MDTPEAIERAAELGMLAGQDYAKALADQIESNARVQAAIAVAESGVRVLVHARITELIDVVDNHNAELWQGEYGCPNNCGFRGTQAEWERHLADKLADALTQAGQ